MTEFIYAVLGRDESNPNDPMVTCITEITSSDLQKCDACQN